MNPHLYKKRKGGPATLLRFANQQVNVVGHHHVSDDDKTIPLPHLLQDSEQQIAPLRRGQPRLAMVTAAIDKMEVVGAVIARGMIGH